MLQPLDGPAIQGKLTSVTSTTPVQAKVGASAYEDRKVLTLQSSKQDSNYGKFYVYFANEGETPINTDVSTKGFIQDINSIHSYEASSSQTVWLMAVTGTIDIRIAERA